MPRKSRRIGFIVSILLTALGSSAIAAIPSDIAAVWQPLRPRSGDPAYARVELKQAWRHHGAKRFPKACKAAVALSDRLMREGAALFYKPVRKGADLAGIKAFMDKYVRGRAPLLQVLHEVLVPSAAVRNLGVDACMRAGKPALARRLIDQAGVSSKDGRLRTAVAVVRLADGQGVSQVGWLVGGDGAGARGLLVRALGAPGGLQRTYIDKARRKMGLSERSDVQAVIAWMKSPAARKARLK